MLHNNPLLDKDFLAALDAHRERETYARIIALSFQEDPLEQIEGRVTQGSINIDGASAVRRTCSLSLVADNLDITDFYWGLKSKFKLEVGLRNTLKNVSYGKDLYGTELYWGDKYPQDIIWFPQGTYIITTFNTAENTNSYTINISGKDKMCMLNGDLGGSLTAAIDFGVEEYYDKEQNLTTYTRVPIETIIKEMIHTYAQEPYHNIIINDLDQVAVELLDYRGDTDMYLLYNVSTGGYTNFTLNGKISCEGVQWDGQKYISTGKKYILDNSNGNTLIYDPRVQLSYDDMTEPTIVYFPDENGGEIQNVYQIARVTTNQTVGYRITDLTYAGDLISSVGESITSILDKIKKMLGEYEYFYDVDGRFIFQRKQTFIQSPWNNIVKVGDEEYAENAAYSSAVFYRFEGNNLITSFSNAPNLANLKNDYAVWGERTGISGVKLPIHYRYAIDIKPTEYQSRKHNINYRVADGWDWRELIYRMAEDYYIYNQEDDYVEKLIELNPETCPKGVTGYEQYYVDIFSFWRELYDENGQWNEQVQNEPDQLNFWFDFLDANSELGQFSIKAVGDRVKAVNDTSVKAIYFRQVPDLIFTTYAKYREYGLDTKTGYTPVFIKDSLENMFNISSQGKSAQDLLDELVYNHSYCIESVTIQAVPVYHLQPNIRIYVSDDKSHVQGEYIVSKLTIPLAYNGTMSITATKAPERIY